METIYRTGEKRWQTGSGRTTNLRKRAKVSLGVREKRRLFQLIACVALFLMVFFGKGLFPDQVLAMREQILTVLHTDTDFTAAFAELGRSFLAGEPVMETLGGLWTDVFGGRRAVEVSESFPLEDAKLFQADLTYLTKYEDRANGPIAYYAGLMLPEIEEEAQPVTTPNLEPLPSPVPEPEPMPEPEEPEVVAMEYNGPPLPEHTSMDKYRLDLEETTTPVTGWLSSAFGWREHPVDGEEKFHNGVDLAVNTGTAVKAFAGGIVEYIGDSPIYGNYLQIDHGNGVTSFYAHCDSLCVQQGQTVTVGETVALSGATGNATGPHLHFELKRNGVRLNPLYYIDLDG